jgi:hypothetical protein
VDVWPGANEVVEALCLVLVQVDQVVLAKRRPDIEGVEWTSPHELVGRSGDVDPDPAKASMYTWYRPTCLASMVE